MSDVSRETEALLARYEALIRKWNASINLVSPTTLPALRYRHIEDSRQLFPYAGLTTGKWLDLGSGGGLPGVVIAIEARELPIKITLIESDARKCAFLNTVRRELELSNLTIANSRIEAAPPAQADAISARALAPLPQLLAYTERHLAPGGSAILLKGRSWREEVDAARVSWQFDLETWPSATEEGAAILRLTNLSHA
ncbi:MAG: 16S rRNA (guanine(527)-N(7))-methyltransferase RsmG [Paracoccus sp. (in: a-proteobacteria)]|nr:16S rRNA (guanine(527)-N(7))-methyltransferase RsmG [Paracoccus sp. (in: a-proteobacteria)]